MGRMPRPLVLVLALVAALTLAGCRSGPDDEMVRPTVTETAAPQPPSDLPDLPVGNAPVQPGDPVRVGGATLHVDGRTADLAPLRVDAWAVVPGGVFFLNRTELWFTDLRRAIPTPYKDVTDLTANADGTRLSFVDHQHGADGPDGLPLPVRITYDARTGAPLGSGYIDE
jgi:hypothetical protein